MPPMTLQQLTDELNAQEVTIQSLLVLTDALQKALDSEKAERAKAIEVGSVTAFAGETVPERYRLCDGAPMKSSDFPALFAAIQTAHGNGVDESGNKLPDHDFNLPDYRGFFLRGVDATGLRDPDVQNRSSPQAGGNGKGSVGSIQPDQFASHGHNVTDPQHTHGYDHLVNTGGPPFAGGIGGAVFSDNRFTTGPKATGISIQSAGGNETRPKNAYVNYIIKVS